jgi:hypothetical protein
MAGKDAADASYAKLRECFIHLAWPSSLDEREKIVSDFEEQVTARVWREVEARNMQRRNESIREEFKRFLVLLRQTLEKMELES